MDGTKMFCGRCDGEMEDMGDYFECTSCGKNITNISPKENTKIDSTLKERGNRYGDFTDHARVTQAIKRAMYDSPNWHKLPDWMKEGMEMTAHKYGRALCGDWTYVDTWHDVCGYNRLIEERLEK